MGDAGEEQSVCLGPLKDSVEPRSQHHEDSVRTGHWLLYLSNTSAGVENLAVLPDCF